MEQKTHKRPVECLKPFPQRLMIIEDDLALSEVLDNLFTDLGYHCRMETDAPEINAIEAFRPDLVIIDYHLPKVNGGEICAALKNNKLLAKTPVIIISAYSSILLHLEGYAFDSFIEKPFSIQEILRPVERLLLKKSLVSQKRTRMPFYFKTNPTGFH
jgi:two-component system response regulator VicR